MQAMEHSLVVPLLKRKAVPISRLTDADTHLAREKLIV